MAGGGGWALRLAIVLTAESSLKVGRASPVFKYSLSLIHTLESPCDYADESLQACS